MSSLLRALRKRLKANPPPVKPKGKLYPGTIDSVSIDGRKFPVLDSGIYTTGELPTWRYPSGIAGLEAAANQLGVVGARKT